MLPPAPVTFSMMIDWFRMVRMRSPRKRASVSVAPPAANGTIRLIGFAAGVVYGLGTLRTALRFVLHRGGIVPCAKFRP